MALSSLAQEYFRTLNPIATKIHSDIEEAKSSYQHLWEGLSQTEREAIINETLIKPDITMKYGLEESLDFDINDLPSFRKDDLMSFFGRDHGRRVVQDESGSYRDEHSAPFSFQTGSQLNLCELANTRNKKEETTSSLVLSHVKVVSELKNALKSHDMLKSNKEKYETQPKHDELASPSSFLTKFMGNMKNKSKVDDKERLVPSGSGEQSVSNQESSFMSTFKNALSPNLEQKLAKDYTNKGPLSKADNSGEGLHLLSHGSSKTDFASSEDIELSQDGSQEALTKSVTRTGFDFLDNW